MQTESIIQGIPASGEAGHFHRLLQEVHRRAYERYLDRQRRQVPGTEAEDWRGAEEEVLARAGMLPERAAPYDPHPYAPCPCEAKPFDVPPPGSRTHEDGPGEPCPFEGRPVDRGPSRDTFASGTWIPEVEGPARPPLSAAELLERMAHLPPPAPFETSRPGLADLEVKDVMTRDLVAVGPDCTVRQLVTVLDQHHASAIPVVDPRKRLLGVVSASDIIHVHAKAATMAAEYIRTGKVPVADADPEVVMGMLTGELLATVRAADACAQLLTVPPRTKVLEVIAMMASRRLDRVLVVDKDHLVGMLAAPDLLRLLLDDPPGSGGQI